MKAPLPLDNVRPKRDTPLVLVVDDYEDARRMYGTYLSFCGFHVEFAGDGLEAVAKAQELLPDLVLMDLSLPKIDGWEATRRLKANKRTQPIQVVVLTAYAPSAHIDRAHELGCEDIISKPCLPDELANKVTALLSSRADGNGNGNVRGIDCNPSQIRGVSY